MTIKELLLKVSKQDLIETYTSTYGEKTRVNVGTLIEELYGLGVIESNTELMVIEHYDFDINGEEGNYSIELNKGYDVFYLGEEEHITIMAEDWEKVLGMKINKLSVENIPLTDILTAILYEMSWFGYSKDIMTQRKEDFLTDIEECEEDFEEYEEEYEEDFEYFDEDILNGIGTVEDSDYNKLMDEGFGIINELNSQVRKKYKI